MREHVTIKKISAAFHYLQVMKKTFCKFFRYSRLNSGRIIQMIKGRLFLLTDKCFVCFVLKKKSAMYKITRMRLQSFINAYKRFRSSLKSLLLCIALPYYKMNILLNSILLMILINQYFYGLYPVLYTSLYSLHLVVEDVGDQVHGVAQGIGGQCSSLNNNHDN